MAPSTRADALHGPGLTDVRMMVVAHLPFRRELGLAPAAVLAVPDRDRARTDVVADHVDLFLGMLQHHHELEDEVLWERLVERVPTTETPLVHLMEAQHEVVAEHLARTRSDLAQWRTSGSRADAMPLAGSLATLVAALVAHLDAEETHVLPLMARHITASEWEDYTELGMASIPPKLRVLGFGMMAHEGDPEVIAREVTRLPAPIRPLIGPLGRLAFRRYARRVHGTSTPPTARELRDVAA